MKSILNRRGLIAGGAAAGLMLGAARISGAAGGPFTLGVASGSPSADGFVIWTRLAPQPMAADGSGGMSGAADVDWEVAGDETMAGIISRGRVFATDDMAHSVHVEVAGLKPDRPYWYRFTALGVQSPIGRARTAPAAGAQLTSLKLAFASCAHWEAGWFSAYRHMAAENPDLTVFLGDYIYEYSYAASRTDLVRRHDRADECRTLAAYRNRYALQKSDPDLQALHAAAPCIATWDDHEVQNDYANVWSQIGTIPVEEFTARRAAAYQAFYEHMPLRRRVMTNLPEVRVYDRYAYGGLADIHLLDGRQYRSIQPCPVGGSRRGHVAPDRCADLHDPSRTMLGQAQEQWLYDGFSKGRARWTIIAQDLLVAPLAEKTTKGEPGAFTDGWSGYEANRARMLNAVASSRTQNPVFFGGDMHAWFATDLKADFSKDGSPLIATEFVGGSVTSDPAGDNLAAEIPANPHIRYFENRSHGYITAQLLPGRMETRFRTISDRRDPHAGIATLKSWVVEDGIPGAQSG